VIRNSDSIPFYEVKAAKDTEMQVLISDCEAPNFAMRRFRMQPGGSMPNHTNSVEHEQYVLSGQAEVGLDDEVFYAKAGDFLYIPPNKPHWYKVIGDEPYEFLCLVPNREDHIQVLP